MHEYDPCDTVTLRPGEPLSLEDALQAFVKWKHRDKIDTTGYALDYYIDRDNRYRGPDMYGVEPVFSATVLLDIFG